MECHDSSVVLIRKLPLSITEALLKSMEWSWDHAWFAILYLRNVKTAAPELRTMHGPMTIPLALTTPP